jgi:hypothetical protein
VIASCTADDITLRILFQFVRGWALKKELFESKRCSLYALSPDSPSVKPINYSVEQHVADISASAVPV